MGDLIDQRQGVMGSLAGPFTIGDATGFSEVLLQIEIARPLEVVIANLYSSLGDKFNG